MASSDRTPGVGDAGESAQSPGPAIFAHPSEREFAQILDFYGLRWTYEPRSFPLRWEDDRVVEMLTPDFYLPDLDLYLELTTLKQSQHLGLGGQGVGFHQLQLIGNTIEAVFHRGVADPKDALHFLNGAMTPHKDHDENLVFSGQLGQRWQLKATLDSNVAEDQVFTI